MAESTVETTEEIATDPKARGKLQAFRAMLEDLGKQLNEIQRKLHEQAGMKSAAQRIAASLAGVADGVRNEGQKEGLALEDVKLRVSLILKCREVATSQVGDAEKERALLQGEARALGKQVEGIRKMYATAVADEQRKSRIAAEEQAERERREGPPKVSPKPKRRASTRKASTRKAGPRKVARKMTPTESAEPVETSEVEQDKKAEGAE